MTFTPFMCKALDTYIDQHANDPSYIQLTPEQMRCLEDEVSRVMKITVEEAARVPFYRGIPIKVKS